MPMSLNMMCVNQMYLPGDYSYKMKEDGMNSTDTFHVKEINDETSAKLWLKKFSEMNKLTWRVLRTSPKAGKVNIYKCCWRCQHFTDRRIKHVRSSKNTNCPAQVVIVVKRFIKKSRAKRVDAILRDYPATIIIRNNHNHEIDTAAILKYRDTAPEIIHKFCDLFKKGHSPSTALNTHKMNLMLEYGDDYYKIAADGKFMPSTSVVYKLFERQFVLKYDTLEGDKMSENLQQLLRDYEENTSGKARFQRTLEGHYFVVLCSPLMIRAHKKIIQSRELVLVNTSRCVDKQKYMIYFFVTPTAAGGIPLGVIITDTEKETVFSEALKYFKILLGGSSFFHKTFPQVFLTNTLEEVEVLNENFPNSRNLLCHFHVLKSFWSWICLPQHFIEQEHQQECYFIFKKLVYSSTEEIAEENFSSLISFANENSYSNLKNHVEYLWQNKETWISYYRLGFPLLGNNTSNYLEVFKILKDCILKSVVTFNLIQLIDFILTTYEMYIRQRLIDFSNDKHDISMLKKMLPLSCDDLQFQIHSDDELHTVTDDKNDSYCVDLMRGICTCDTGYNGILCKHASVVILTIDYEIFTSYNLECQEIKEDILYVAEGTVPPKNWFLTLPNLLAVDDPKNNKTLSEVALNAVENKTSIEEESSIDQATAVIVPKNSIITEQSTQLDDLFQRIKNGLINNPESFVPAVKKMLNNSQLYASESGLVSAISTFGTFCELKSIAKTRHNRKSKAVQPRSVGTRKYCLFRD